MDYAFPSSSIISHSFGKKKIKKKIKAKETTKISDSQFECCDFRNTDFRLEKHFDREHIFMESEDLV